MIKTLFFPEGKLDRLMVAMVAAFSLAVILVLLEAIMKP